MVQSDRLTDDTNNAPPTPFKGNTARQSVSELGSYGWTDETNKAPPTPFKGNTARQSVSELGAMVGQRRPIRHCIHQLKETQQDRVLELESDGWTEKTNKVSHTPAKGYIARRSLLGTWSDRWSEETNMVQSIQAKENTRRSVSGPAIDGWTEETNKVLSTPAKENTVTECIRAWKRWMDRGDQ